MTANMKAVLCFAVGLVGGAVASYFYLDAKYEKLLDERVEEETKAIRAKYTGMLEKYDLVVNRKVAEDGKDEVRDISAGQSPEGNVSYGTYASESYIPVKGASEDSVNQMRDEIDKVSKDAHEDFEAHMASLEHPEDDEEEETEEERLEREGRELTEEAKRLAMSSLSLILSALRISLRPIPITRSATGITTASTRSWSTRRAMSSMTTRTS